MKKNKVVQAAALLLSMLLLVSLCACGGNKIEAPPAIQQSENVSPELTEQPAAGTAEADKSDDYASALTMMVDGDYEGAAAAFEALGDYKDSAARA